MIQTKKIFELLIIACLIHACSEVPEVFMSEEYYKANVVHLHELNAQRRMELAQFATSPNSALNLNIYFVTDDSMKVLRLARTLEKKGYATNRIHPSPKDKGLWVLNATSGRVSMDSSALNTWSDSLCYLSYHHDCEFEGWNPVTE